MNSSQILPAIKQMIAEGNVDLALTRLIEFLESDPVYAELLQIARVNQADLYQNKASLLKGTISTEDNRLALNQVTDNVLQIVARVESGRFSHPGQEIPPTRSQAWRYYVAGGIVALAVAIAIWKFLGGSFSKATEDACPNFSSKYQWKVMVLPFKNTGTSKKTPEFDISDGLNNLIQKTPAMVSSVIADVNEKYKIDENYPNPEEAADIARNCDAQMIVWGKINDSESGSDYKLDVFYKLLDAGGVRLTGDTTLSSLLKIKEDGKLQLVADVDAVVRLLYVVLANQSRMPIAANLIKVDTISAKMSALGTTPPVDTAIALAMADNLVQNNKKEEAIQVYDNVISAYPTYSEARQKRGALLYEKGDFAGAARDLDAAAPKAEKASSSLLRLRLDASLKSGQPDKANDDLKQLKKTKNYDGAWINKKNTEVSDSLLVFQIRRDKKERMATSQPQNTKAQIDAGRANIAVGDSERAIKNAEKALKINPKNAEAYEIKIVANAHKGDTMQVRRELEKATKEGINVKGILNNLPPTVRGLAVDKDKRQ
jgi:Flp pilus assembly protein TadD